jgi:hypothetical protein
LKKKYQLERKKDYSTVVHQKMISTFQLKLNLPPKWTKNNSQILISIINLQEKKIGSNKTAQLLKGLG